MFQRPAAPSIVALKQGTARGVCYKRRFANMFEARDHRHERARRRCAGRCRQGCGAFIQEPQNYAEALSIAQSYFSSTWLEGMRLWTRPDARYTELQSIHQPFCAQGHSRHQLATKQIETPSTRRRWSIPRPPHRSENAVQKPVGSADELERTRRTALRYRLRDLTVRFDAGAAGSLLAGRPRIALSRRRRICLFGWPSGCGKTTILNLLAGLLPRDQRARCTFSQAAGFR